MSHQPRQTDGIGEEKQALDGNTAIDIGIQNELLYAREAPSKYVTHLVRSTALAALTSSIPTRTVVDEEEANVFYRLTAQLETALNEQSHILDGTFQSNQSLEDVKVRIEQSIRKIAETARASLAWDSEDPHIVDAITKVNDALDQLSGTFRLSYFNDENLLQILEHIGSNDPEKPINPNAFIALPEKPTASLRFRDNSNGDALWEEVEESYKPVKKKGDKNKKKVESGEKEHYWNIDTPAVRNIPIEKVKRLAQETIDDYVQKMDKCMDDIFIEVYPRGRSLIEKKGILHSSHFTEKKNLLQKERSRAHDIFDQLLYDNIREGEIICVETMKEIYSNSVPAFADPSVIKLLHQSFEDFFTKLIAESSSRNNLLQYCNCNNKAIHTAVPQEYIFDRKRFEHEFSEIVLNKSKKMIHESIENQSLNFQASNKLMHQVTKELYGKLTPRIESILEEENWPQDTFAKHKNLMLKIFASIQEVILTTNLNIPVSDSNFFKESLLSLIQKKLAVFLAKSEAVIDFFHCADVAAEADNPLFTVFKKDQKDRKEKEKKDDIDSEEFLVEMTVKSNKRINLTTMKETLESVVNLAVLHWEEDNYKLSVPESSQMAGRVYKLLETTMKGMDGHIPLLGDIEENIRSFFEENTNLQMPENEVENLYWCITEVCRIWRARAETIEYKLLPNIKPSIGSFQSVTIEPTNGIGEEFFVLSAARHTIADVYALYLKKVRNLVNKNNFKEVQKFVKRFTALLEKEAKSWTKSHDFPLHSFEEAKNVSTTMAEKTTELIRSLNMPASLKKHEHELKEKLITVLHTFWATSLGVLEGTCRELQCSNPEEERTKGILRYAQSKNTTPIVTGFPEECLQEQYKMEFDALYDCINGQVEMNVLTKTEAERIYREENIVQRYDDGFDETIRIRNRSVQKKAKKMGETLLIDTSKDAEIKQKAHMAHVNLFKGYKYPASIEGIGFVHDMPHKVEQECAYKIFIDISKDLEAILKERCSKIPFFPGCIIKLEEYLIVEEGTSLTVDDLTTSNTNFIQHLLDFAKLYIDAHIPKKGRLHTEHETIIVVDAIKTMFLDMNTKEIRSAEELESFLRTVLQKAKKIIEEHRTSISIQEWPRINTILYYCLEKEMAKLYMYACCLHIDWNAHQKFASKEFPFADALRTETEVAEAMKEVMEKQKQAAPEQEPEAKQEPEKAPTVLTTPHFLQHWWKHTWDDFMARNTIENGTSTDSALVSSLKPLNTRVKKIIKGASEDVFQDTATFNVFMQQLEVALTEFPEFIEYSNDLIATPNKRWEHHFKARLTELEENIKPQLTEVEEDLAAPDEDEPEEVDDLQQQLEQTQSVDALLNPQAQNLTTMIEQFRTEEKLLLSAIEAGGENARTAMQQLIDMRTAIAEAAKLHTTYLEAVFPTINHGTD